MLNGGDILSTDSHGGTSQHAMSRKIV